MLGTSTTSGASGLSFSLGSFCFLTGFWTVFDSILSVTNSAAFSSEHDLAEAACVTSLFSASSLAETLPRLLFLPVFGDADLGGGTVFSLPRPPVVGVALWLLAPARDDQLTLLLTLSCSSPGPAWPRAGDLLLVRPRAWPATVLARLSPGAPLSPLSPLSPVSLPRSDDPGTEDLRAARPPPPRDAAGETARAFPGPARG